jgi:peptidoglycan/LPS O-acetylase OafA/YrhL
VQRRFATLDGLRGIAALAVVSGHMPATWGGSLFPHFTLAVDLFFILSGFVLAYAYENKFAAGMGTREFMFLRLVRLYPLYLFGTAVAAASVAAAILMGQARTFDMSTLLLALLAALLFLPSPTFGQTDRIAPLNYPSWSLMFELLANLIYVAFYRKLTDAVLAAIVAVSVIAMIVTEMRIGNLAGGVHWSDIGVGLVRVGFGFPLGILLFRRLPRRRIVSGWAYVFPLLTLPILAAPFSSPVWVELPALLLLFPLIVTMGAVIEPPDERVFLFLGATSYGIYIIHLPVVTLISRATQVKGLSFASIKPAPMVIVIAALIAVCAWLDRNFDAPVRRALMQRFGKVRTHRSLRRQYAARKVAKRSLLRSFSQRFTTREKHGPQRRQPGFQAERAGQEQAPDEQKRG